MINQIIFNLLLRNSVTGLPYKFLFKLRGLLLSINPNAEVLYRYKNYWLTFPFSHDYPLNKKFLKQYSENLGVVAAIVKQKYANATMIDVGANIGDSAAIIQSYVPVPILCIEGNPKFIPMLTKNAAGLSEITIEQCFVGDQNETVVPVNTGGTARLETSVNGIEVKTMQQILAKHSSFAAAKLLKIDTDGFDNKIIRASADLLARAKPVLFFEYDPFFLKKQQEDPSAVFEVLHSLEYNRLILFDNLGKLLCEVTSDNKKLLADLTAYYHNEGKSYLDICALHISDEDLVEKIKQAFVNPQ